jgi:D-serine deaminase-like pyridoxal phosphate-dependent protein
MNSIYRLHDTSTVSTPTLLFYGELLRRNLAHALTIARHPSRLRPHVKTHKTREIVRLALQAGVTKHKCATLAEAEMLASCGAPDVFLAYPMVGPNCRRLARLCRAYPDCRFSVTADDLVSTQTLSETLRAERQTVDVLIDLDTGQHRTGLPLDDGVEALYTEIARLPALRPGGLHVYDGHNHQDEAGQRKASALRELQPVLALRSRLEQRGLPVPRLVVGGTPTFPVYAELEIPGLECSPGTCFLHDAGYGGRFADLSAFTPAALLLTRVISKPTPTRLTLDLGYKAVASDPPAGKRCTLLDVPDAVGVIHNEEHLVVETPAAAQFRIGDTIYAIPTHICPTVALHQRAQVVEEGRIVASWDIVARDRVLTV